LIVEGNEVITDDKIIAMSGLELGMPVFDLDAETVVRRLRLISRLNTVDVRQKGSREIVISVSEKKPVARILFHGESVEIGPDGAIIGTATDVCSVLPWILGANVLPAQGGVGERLEAEVAGLLRIWLPKIEDSALKGFSAISFPSKGKIVVMWNDIEFYLTDGEATEKNLQLLQGLMIFQQKSARSYQYVDLRFQDIVVRFQDID